MSAIEEQVNPHADALARWVERGVCPRAGHAIASEEDLYVVPSSGNVQCRACRTEIRRSYKADVKSGAKVPVPGRFHGGPRVLVTLDGTPDAVRDWAGLNPAVHAPVVPVPTPAPARRRRS